MFQNFAKGKKNTTQISIKNITTQNNR